MQYTIENERFVVTIDSKGAELSSMRAKVSGTEYVWQADPAIWGRHAPILFPIVGRLKDKTYRVGGEAYTITQHGFGRDLEFACTAQSEHSIDFTLTPNAYTKHMYPYDFALTVRYTLEQDTLKKEHITTNNGDTDMYYEVGGHDAYRVALEPGEVMADYYVDFGEGDAIHPLINDESLMITKEKRDVPLQDGKLYLTSDLFALDALILDDIKVRSVSVKSDKSAHCIRMDFADFPYLGIWSKYTGTDTNYVCIEPWSTLPDAAYLDHDLENKVGVRCLKPGETETLVFSTTITQ
ncbi:MAG: aldose 1-epimerase family protein [Eubacteriales bacterium]|nr:aldose 1-epimerase family protein [Eubacteriales bacterium]